MLEFLFNKLADLWFEILLNESLHEGYFFTLKPPI